jgi:hypothetical protein
MTITRPPAPVPTDLTIARLYLDDVEEIVQILLDAEKKLDLEPFKDGPDDAVKVEFTVGEDTAARTCDSIGDLRKISRSTQHFELRVTRRFSYRAILTIGGLTNRIWTDGLSYDEEVAVFHRVEHVFRQRRLLLRDLSSKIPPWSGGAGFAVVYVGSLLLLYSNVWHIGAALAIVSMGTAGYFTWRVTRGLASIIVFRNYSEQDEVRRERVGKFFFEAGKVIAPFLLGILAHKYWP